MRVWHPHHLTFLGEGQNGIVLLVDGSIEGRRVVKITYSKRFKDEAKLMEKLHVLKPDTQAFIAVFGWYERSGLLPEWREMLPQFRQDGSRLDWEKYDREKLVYIFMEHSNFRMAYPNPSAPAGVVFWEHISLEQSKKIMFILLHGLYVARKKLGFSHNDIHDGQIVLFKRDPKVPVVLEKGYTVKECRYMPKFIDFGASTLGGNKSSDDVGQLVATFHRLYSQEDLMDTLEFDAAAGSDPNDYKVVKELMDSSYFDEFKSDQKREKSISLCIGCLNPATSVIEDTNFHVCSEFCANRLLN